MYKWLRLSKGLTNLEEEAALARALMHIEYLIFALELPQKNGASIRGPSDEVVSLPSLFKLF